jgi:hypothetical protein
MGMKTNNYWSAIISTGLIAGLLFAAALPSAALPGPDDWKNLQNEVNKAAAASEANPTPRPVSTPEADPFPSKLRPMSTSTPSAKAGSTSNAFQDRYAPNPKPVNSDNVLWGDYPQAPSSTPKTTASSTYDAPSSKSKFSSSPSHWTPDSAGQKASWDQHKKHKHHYRGDDQDQGHFSGKKHWNKNSEEATSTSIQPVDKPPSETTVLPYFEVDTNKKGTLFDIDNKNGVDKAQSQKPTSDTTGATSNTGATSSAFETRYAPNPTGATSTTGATQGTGGQAGNNQGNDVGMRRWQNPFTNGESTNSTLIPPNRDVDQGGGKGTNKGWGGVNTTNYTSGGSTSSSSPIKGYTTGTTGATGATQGTGAQAWNNQGGGGKHHKQQSQMQGQNQQTADGGGKHHKQQQYQQQTQSHGYGQAMGADGGRHQQTQNQQQQSHQQQQQPQHQQGGKKKNK